MRDGTIPLDLIEPGACGFGQSENGRALFSIAISLRRIADLMHGQTHSIEVRAPGNRDRPPTLDPQLWAEFTPAERVVAMHLARGLETPAIAKLIGRAQGTAKVHINHIMRKSGVKTRAAFIARLYRLGELS